MNLSARRRAECEKCVRSHPDEKPQKHVPIMIQAPTLLEAIHSKIVSKGSRECHLFYGWTVTTENPSSPGFHQHRNNLWTEGRNIGINFDEVETWDVERVWKPFRPFEIQFNRNFTEISQNNFQHFVGL